MLHLQNTAGPRQAAGCRRRTGRARLRPARRRNESTVVKSFAPRRPEQHIPFHWNETIQGAFVNQQEVSGVVVNTDTALERHFKKRS